MGIKVFLDMDGVICDFMGALHKELGVEYDPNRYPYAVSKYDIFEDLCARSDGRVSMDNLYRACDKSSFWSEMAWEKTGKSILSTIFEVVKPEAVTICTSPMANPDAWAGKVSWLNKNLPAIKNITITTAPKHHMAKSGHVLIDDKDSNVEKFVAAGGAAFLVPQPWNKQKDLFATNYIPKLKGFLDDQMLKDEFFNNPVKLVMRVLS